MPTHFLYHFNNGYSVLHILNLVTDILYETPGYPWFDSLADKEFWVLITIDVLKFKAI